MAQDALKQSTLARFRMSQLVLAPRHEVDLATDVIRDRIAKPGESIPVHLTDEQNVDIATGIVDSGGKRSKDHAEADPAHVHESLGKELRHATLSTHEPSDGSDAVALRIDRPQSQVPDAPARYSSGLEEVIERQLRRVRIGIDAPRDFARVNLAP